MIDEKWTSPEYMRGTTMLFNEIDQYLVNPPKRILDIGCGHAHVSQQFQKKYGTELWLLEGDFNENPQAADRKAKYGPKENFQFYTPIPQLKEHWDKQGIKYRFVDANNIDIPDDVEFDFVCSWISCGFHYPAATYKSLIQKHTNEDSVVIMDFRRKSLAEQSKDFDIVHYINGNNGQKKYKLHIKFK
jgi:SAM-dependent methyltransferase